MDRKNKVLFGVCWYSMTKMAATPINGKTNFNDLFQNLKAYGIEPGIFEPLCSNDEYIDHGLFYDKVKHRKTV